jgi:pullulanase
MKKVLVLLMMFLSSFSLISYVKADEAVSEIYIHYYRYAGDYDNWNIWGWQNLPEGLDGQAFQFEEDETGVEFNYGGVVTVIDVQETFPDITRMGLIVRKGEWLEKDIDGDRLVDIPEMTSNGEFHIYLVEGDARIGTSLTDPDGPDKSPKFKNAYFTDLDIVYFTTTEEISGSSVVVKEDDIEVTTTDVVIDGTSGTVTLANDLDFAKSYTIEATFPSDSSVNDYSITFDGIYDSEEFEIAFGYEGDDLGSIVDGNTTTFRVWAPVSQSVKLNIYDTGTPLSLGGTDTPVRTVDMVKDVKGTFYYEEASNLHGSYYTYSVTNGSMTNETIDPYAKSAGVNGIRGMVVDFAQVNPTGFTYSNRPSNMENATDAIIYELHVRDLTSHSSWNGTETNRGKFLGLTESGTTYEGYKTGFDHIKDLGVTHVQILPFFDFGVVDESKLDDSDYNSFNWGYMPLNFNVPEGSYSSDPFDGETRVRELKQMIMEFGEADIRINMDVVYNHHGLTADSNFEKIVPGYYFRKTSSGAFSNGSGTGNETASERVMMRKFMIDSVKFWAEEYNISGFRFDLMALHDIETMVLLEEALKEIDPTIMVYGEPWMGGTSPLNISLQGGKKNLAEMATVGAFNDDLRDAVKGSVFARDQGGFIQGEFTANNDMRIKYGIVGGIAHPAITGSNLTAQKVWHTEPIKTINYVTAHDNNTLHDKLYLTLEESERLDLIPALQKQANAIVLTSQGIAFLHAGDELLRSKPLADGEGFDHNSYESPDSTNQIRWDLMTGEETQDVYNYYKGLIELRKSHESFRMTDKDDVIDNIRFIEEDLEGLIAFEIANQASDDEFKTIVVFHNANEKEVKVKLLGDGNYYVLVDGEDAGTEVIDEYAGGDTITLSANSTYVIHKDVVDLNAEYNFSLSSNLGLIIGGIIGGVAIAAGVVVFIVLNKRK